jgi:hypothetical protein
MADESLAAFIGRHARTATSRQLLTTLSAASAVAAAIILTGLQRWPLAALAGTVAVVALWGLTVHRPHPRHPRAMSALALLWIVLGSILAVIAAFGLLFWVLGPSWNL